jgi:hypothetical protein
MAPQLERQGLPKIDPLMKGRFWPAVEAFFRNRHGLGKDGARIPCWRTRKKAVALGYRQSVTQLMIDANDHAAIAERCREEWAKVEAWLINERPAPVFDATIGSLIDLPGK